jgi:hypothetical protein
VTDAAAPSYGEPELPDWLSFDNIKLYKQRVKEYKLSHPK